MKVGIYQRVDAPSQTEVSKAIVEGCRRMKENPYVFMVENGEDPTQVDADVIVLFGIGGDAKRVYEANRGKRMILLDKPYIRQIKVDDARVELPRYHLMRVTVDAFQPLKYFQVIKRSPERWNALKIDVTPYHKRKQESILFDGASNKYVHWNNLGNGVGSPMDQWAEWGQRMVNKIREHTWRPITYRPRPSHNPFPYPSSCRVSVASLPEDFEKCCLVVSHGGNIGYNAVVNGIPHFAIGDSIARPISETNWKHVGRPFIPDEDARKQWLWDLAYCQWNLNEFRSGVAWNYIRETMEIIDGLR